MSVSRLNADRTWMNLNDRFCKEYIEGVRSFLEVAGTVLNESRRTRCPCINCVNTLFATLREIREHLHMFGISQGYTRWTYHGENFKKCSTSSSVHYVEESLTENDDEDDGMLAMFNGMQGGAFYEYERENLENRFEGEVNVNTSHMESPRVSESDDVSEMVDSSSSLHDIDAIEKNLGHKLNYKRVMVRGSKRPPKSSDSSRSFVPSQADRLVQTQHKLDEVLKYLEVLRARDLEREEETRKLRSRDLERDEETRKLRSRDLELEEETRKLREDWKTFMRFWTSQGGGGAPGGVGNA